MKGTIRCKLSRAELWAPSRVFPGDAAADGEGQVRRGFSGRVCLQRVHVRTPGARGTVHDGSASNRRRDPAGPCLREDMPCLSGPRTQGTGSSVGRHSLLPGDSGVRPAGPAPLLLLIMGRWARRCDFRVEQGRGPPVPGQDSEAPPRERPRREVAGGGAEARGRGWSWGWGRPARLTERWACPP